MSIPAGWYDDGSGKQRWWDGEAWTEHFTDPAAEAETPVYQAQPQGQPYAPAAGHQPYAAPTNGLAIAALVTGILGLGIIPVIFGHIALSQIKRNPAQSGKGMAIAGLVLGYALIAVIALFVIFGILAAIGASLSSAIYR